MRAPECVAWCGHSPSPSRYCFRAQGRADKRGGLAHLAGGHRSKTRTASPKDYFSRFARSLFPSKNVVITAPMVVVKSAPASQS